MKAYLVRNLFNKISTCDDPAIKPILLDLARIFALYHIADSASAFVSNYYCCVRIDKNFLGLTRGISLWELNINFTKIRLNTLSIILVKKLFLGYVVLMGENFIIFENYALLYTSV